jgi:hypothetical protein
VYLTLEKKVEGYTISGIHGFRDISVYFIPLGSGQQRVLQQIEFSKNKNKD